MTVELRQLSTGTVFKVRGREYRIGGMSGPIKQNPHNGQWEPWYRGHPEDEKRQGLSAEPKLGGHFPALSRFAAMVSIDLRS